MTSPAKTTKPWQHGYSVDYLRSVQDRFGEYNRFARGPFGEMNRRNIAEALHRNQLHITDWGVVEQTITARITPITAYLDVVLARKQPGDRVVSAFTYNHPAR